MTGSSDQSALTGINLTAGGSGHTVDGVSLGPLGE